MIENLNNTYFIAAVLMNYVFLILFSSILTSEYVRNIYQKTKEKLSGVIRKNKYAEQIFNFIVRKVLPAIKVLVIKFVHVLHSISIIYNKIDLFIQNEIFGNLDEPVNYSALTLRKLYEVNSRLWVIYSIISMVAFYFILTIF